MRTVDYAPSIEYPYDGPAFAFKRNGDHFELIDNTRELLTLPNGEEIVAPVNHRYFRESKIHRRDEIAKTAGEPLVTSV